MDGLRSETVVKPEPSCFTFIRLQRDPDHSSNLKYFASSAGLKRGAEYEEMTLKKLQNREREKAQMRQSLIDEESNEVY